MAGPPDQQNPATKADPTSPARSDKSSDSEGKPVRDKLKETRIDAQAAKDPATTSDKAMHDAPNGSTNSGDQSASGSDSERGRLRRKRSREDFEKDDDVDKPAEKKQEHDKTERHHTRKKSRDAKDIESGLPLKSATNPVSTIEENDTDEHMTSPNKDSTKEQGSATADNSPKNKRTRDQAETAEDKTVENGIANGKPVSSAAEERDSKRPRDKAETESADAKTENKTKVYPGSGFANTSAESPFAAMAAKPQAPKTVNSTDSQPQTSDEKFKASGFGSFASSTASPFGGLKSPGSSSPFGAAAGGNKLASFAGSKASPEPTGSGFGGLGSSKSVFGGSPFGSSLGGGFGGLASTKPGLSSFATPADLTIKGLKSKPSAFGTPADQDKSDESDGSDGDDDENEKDSNEEEHKSSQPVLSQQPQETGEEGENTLWTGRAKLYTMAGEGSSRAWKESGVGTFKFNITIDEPKKARFVLRADGTHRLLLNAAVTKQLIFGADSEGGKPKDGKLVFNTLKSAGEVEMHLLKLKAERAVELWEEVNKVKDTEL